MFEQELALEKKTFSILPLLLLVALIVAIVGVSLYFLAESRRVLTAAEARPVVLASLDSQPVPTLRFLTGDLDASVSDRVREPHYRLLEKEGIIKIGKGHKGNIGVTLTREGQAFLDEITGVKQSKKDGNLEYVVPMGQRKLVDLGKITMLTPAKAAVEYSWKWEPTKAGDLFDAAGPAVKAFNTWDRATLIEKYGAHFYHAAPTTVTVALVKTENGWQVSTGY